LILFAIPDVETESNRFEIAVPKLGSWILTHEWEGEIRGLKSFPADERPNPVIPFFAFRLMVGIGLIMIAIGVGGGLLWLLGRLFTTRWYLHFTFWAWPLGFIAVVAGWFVTEVGRQPWTVYGILRTADSASPVLGGKILTSLILFLLVYGVIFGAGLYYISRLVQRGPEPVPPIPEEGEADPSRRPMAAAGAP
jgi:cytochrome d ubiquinol oxidase subunit I